MTDFCRELSLAAGEPLAGSAAHVRAWIVLDVREPWEKKHLPGSSLPPPIKERIERWLDEVPDSRLQFIRRPGDEGAPIRFFLARADLPEPWLLGFQLGGYDELLSLDVPDILRAGEHPHARRIDAPIYLVCCHGKRDRCCAKFGIALYEHVFHACPERAWHTTHLGGHRFAATMAVLPHGICYGRLDQSEGEAIVDAHERGEVHDPARMRGRSSYEPAVQVAEIEARLRTGDRSIGGPVPHDVERLADRTRVRFADDLVIEVAEQRIDGERPTSCGDSASAIEGLVVRR